MPEFTVFNILLGGAIITGLGAIIWAIWHAGGNDEKIDVDAGDVGLLAAGLQDPMLGVAAYAASGGEDGGDDALLPEETTAPETPLFTHVESPEPSIAKEIFTHVESPPSYTPEPTHESYSSYSSDSYSSSDSGSSNGGCDSGGSGGGGD